MGDPDKADLQAELERTGWDVQRYAGEDWWEHEVWELASTWRPVDAKVFLTFLVDPFSETSKVADVWAVGITLKRPSSRMEADSDAISVRPRWPERMKEIVAAVGSLRPSS